MALLKSELSLLVQPLQAWTVVETRELQPDAPRGKQDLVGDVYGGEMRHRVKGFLPGCLLESFYSARLWPLSHCPTLSSLRGPKPS